MNAGSYTSRMSRLTGKKKKKKKNNFVFCVIALCNVETDIYNLYKYAFLATINLHTLEVHANHASYFVCV